MPQDHLQIGLEHHRAGRVRQAESAYRTAVSSDADNADALHWLGVLLTQAGKPADALPLLKRAVALREDDAAFQHNLGQALLMVGNVRDAIAALTESAALEPTRAETFLALARAYALRRLPSDASAAVTALRRAREQGIDTPELHHDLGVALLVAGQPDEAIVELASAIKAKPDYAAAHFQTAMAHRAKADRKSTRNWLNKALELDRDYAQAWHALGVIDAEVANFDLAIGHFRRAVRIQPRLLAAQRALEETLRKIGRDREADEVAVHLAATDAAGTDAGAVSHAGAMGCGTPLPVASAAASHGQTSTSAHGTLGSTDLVEPSDDVSAAIGELEDRVNLDAGRQRLHEALSAMAGLVSPARATPAAIADLFDKYAERFEHHLRDKLSYAGPEQLAAAVANARRDDRLLDTADLGCGTGLCGPLLRPMSRSLVGVDLSVKMLEKAQARGVYDRLETGDLLDFLRRSPASFDLLIAADVLIYLGDLTPMFELAERSLRPGGLFAASFEAGDAERYARDHRTRRFMHSRAYLDKLGKIFGFAQRSMEQVTLRYEMHSPVEAWIAVFEKP